MNEQTQAQFETSHSTLKENQNNSNSTSEEQFRNEQIPNTPYRLIGNKSKGYVLAIGTYIITQPKPTPDEAEDELNSNTWNIIFNTIILLNNLLKNETNQ